MDAAYDDTDVYKHCVEKSIDPIIAINPRNQENMAVNPKVNTDEKGHFYCSKTNFRLVKNGTEPKRKGRIKLTCPDTKERKSLQTYMLSQLEGW